MKVVMIHDMPSYDNTSTYQISRRWENIKKLQLMLFGMHMHYHTPMCHSSSRPLHGFDLRSQGQIIEFRELSNPGCNFFIFSHRRDIWYVDVLSYDGMSCIITTFM
jgi:hypothetical protein